MIDLKYTEILSQNKQLGLTLKSEQFKVSVLSNIITTQFNEIFEYALRSQNINAIVNTGDYDNIIQDSEKYNSSNVVIVFWEASNIIEGLQYRANLMSADEIEILLSKTYAEIDFVLQNLKDTAQIIFNTFSSVVFNYKNIADNNYDFICKNLNDYLLGKKQQNLVCVDIDKIIAHNSIANSIDFRFFYSSKALYTISFFKHYATHIKALILSNVGKAKKVLVFDCDNTLWKGILGEDGFDKIEMSSQTKSGVLYEEVQSMAVELAKSGILIGLCSKNNAGDVENVLNSHPDIVLKNEYITIKKVNWIDKVTNIKNIAKELNVGLDSIVFVDDSEFELGHVKEFLPEVTTFRVPQNLYEYPAALRDKLFLFYSNKKTAEDKKRTDFYNQEQLRSAEQSTFSNIEDYLKSLQLQITVYKNPLSSIPRLSQLSQKTNQFNLTTRRYTEAQITNFLESNNYLTFAFSTADKFGDTGIVGLCIMQIKNKIAAIDTFLMSCRVIGRNIEIAFVNYLINYLKEIGIEKVESSFIKSLKNAQVEDFYTKMGFQNIHNAEKNRDYELSINSYTNKSINYIKINDGREN